MPDKMAGNRSLIRFLFLYIREVFMIKQKYLSSSALVAFITFMNMFIPLSIDLYLPALPQMSAYFSTNETLVNLTLVSFFCVFAIGIILFGPISDKYGRKKALIVGVVIYSIASLLCAISMNLYMLIASRILQALGAGCVITVATALIKDCFSSAKMNRILAITQALAVIAPMTAPIIGGILLQFTSWQGTFFLLCILGLLNLIPAFLFTETLPEEKRYQGSLTGSLTLLWKFGRNRGFMQNLTMFSLLAAPYMAYLSVSSYVYIEYFNLTAQMYSYFFAINSAAAFIGPILYLQLSRNMTDNTMTKVCFVIALLSGIAVMVLGNIGPFFFLLTFLPFTIIEAVARPFSMSMLLSEVNDDAGYSFFYDKFYSNIIRKHRYDGRYTPMGKFYYRTQRNYAFYYRHSYFPLAMQPGPYSLRWKRV